MSVLELCQALIQKESITPHDRNCQSLLRKEIQPWLTLQHQWQDHGVTNSLWVIGHSGPLFLWAGHTDVVPPGNTALWQHPPFSGHIDQEHIHGRGAQDMKGSLAAMTTATQRFCQHVTEPKIRIGFAITSDEEGDAKFGTQSIVEKMKHLGLRARWCMVGEPTSVNTLGDQLKNGRRGSCTLSVTISMPQKHVAYTPMNQNPGHAMAQLISSLQNRQWPKHPSFPQLSMHVVQLDCQSVANNVTPESSHATLNFRYPSHITADDIIQVIETQLANLPHHIHLMSNNIPFYFEPSKWHQELAKIIALKTETTPQFTCDGGTSDGRYLQFVSDDLVEFGPLNDRIHQTNERASIQTLKMLEDLYFDVLMTTNQMCANS